MTNHFVGAFSPYFLEFLPKPYSLHQCDNKFIFNIYSSDIFQNEDILVYLKSSACSGLDIILSVFFRKMFPSVSYSCCQCSETLSPHCVPPDWKDVDVKSVNERGVHSDLLHYRPTSLTSVCSTSLENYTLPIFTLFVICSITFTLSVWFQIWQVSV